MPDPDVLAELRRSDIRTQLLPLLDQMRTLYGAELGRGMSRVAFDGGDAIYKVPISHQGIAHCEREAAEHERPDHYAGCPVAACRLVWHSSGLPVLVMEPVRAATRGERRPSWARRVDSNQVGRNAHGRWVVFDASHDLLEDHALQWIEHRVPRALA
jgi:hypothetical protein